MRCPPGVEHWRLAWGGSIPETKGKNPLGGGQSTGRRPNCAANAGDKYVTAARAFNLTSPTFIHISMPWRAVQGSRGALGEER